MVNFASDWNQLFPTHPIGIGDLGEFGGKPNFNRHPAGGHAGGTIIDIRPMTLLGGSEEKRLGGAHKSVGAPDFYIYLDEDSYARDPYSLIHELFHGAAVSAAQADPGFMKYINRHGGLRKPKERDHSPDSKDPEDWYNAGVFDDIARNGCTKPIDWNW